MEASFLRALGLPIVGSFLDQVGCSCADADTSSTSMSCPAESADAVERPSLSAEERALIESMRRRLPVPVFETEFSVISFNMLLKGFDRKPYYPGVGPDLRNWQWRKEKLVDLLFGLDADICCMQEVEAASFDEEFAFLSQGGYAWVAPKDDSKGKMPEIAKTAIFFKADKFEKVWEEHRSRVVLAALRHRITNRLVFVASAHLEGAPWQGATRFTQARNALESMRKQMLKLKGDPGLGADGAPVIFAGDFNEEEHAAVCTFLREGALQASFRNPGYEEEVTKADAAHDFGLQDLYAAWPSGARPHSFCAPPDATCAWGMEATFSAVDFVFYSRSNLRPVAIREPFTKAQQEATEGVGMPSRWHFSDHVPVGGVFEFGSGASEDVVVV